MEERDVRDLGRAVELLERPSFIARVTNLIGQPIERFVEFLPSDASSRLQDGVRSAMGKLLDLAVRTLDQRQGGRASNLIHKVASGISGSIGGFFGVPALAVELPITTSIILRSIADIARAQGEDLSTIEARLACLEVFALGGRSTSDNGSETGYFAVRAALAKAVTDAARHIAERGLTQEGAPVIARLVAQLASRFSAVASEKFAAQAVPVVGALGGAGVNVLFLDHFQDVALGHFIVRRLERGYGREQVQREYRRLQMSMRKRS